MQTVELEELATIFATELIKEMTAVKYDSMCVVKQRVMKQDFLKMSHKRRRKIVEKVLDKMLGSPVSP